MGILDGKVAIVTGAGRGMGKEEALFLAKEGAKVVVADIGTARDEMTQDKTPAEEVVNEIKKNGGEAMASYTNVADFNAAKKMIDNTVREFGKLNILVNNAGILRDRMLINMSEDDWDAVIAVHLKGTFNCTRHAAVYWREEFKFGRDRSGAVINTVSDTGLFGNPGQTNYGSAKGGIASFTINAALELARYGVSVNAISPAARTRMTEDVPTSAAVMAEPPKGEFDFFHPGNVAPLVAYLGSDEGHYINGMIFHVMGGIIDVMEGWGVKKTISKSGRWTVEELKEKMEELSEGVEGIDEISMKLANILGRAANI